MSYFSSVNGCLIDRVCKHEYSGPQILQRTAWQNLILVEAHMAYDVDTSSRQELVLVQRHGPMENVIRNAHCR